VGDVAIDEFFLNRDQYHIGKFPTPDEFAVVCGRVWDRQVEAAAQAEQDLWAENAQIVFHQERTEGEPESIATFSAQMMRDVLAGKIKYGSDEWNARMAESERRWPEHPKSCICEDGLVHYTVHRQDREYSKVARCTCGLGERHPYKHLRQMDPYTNARVA